MATRTTAEDVKAIMDTDLTEDQIEPVVSSANVFVTAQLGASGLGVDLLTEIEKWVAAHMCSVGLDRQLQRGKGGSAEATYAGNYDKGLQMTSYGQMACSMDPTGILAASGGKAAIVKAVTSFS